MEINCNSILSPERAAIFKATVEHHSPDIIFGCESKLSPDTPTGACFPQGYTIYRKEREFGSGGGVFLAVANNLTSIGHPEFCTDDSNESVWASIKLRGNKLRICALSTNHQVPQYHALIISQIFLLIFTREEEVAVRPLWPLGILILVT